jgi:hypothetical protein
MGKIAYVFTLLYDLNWKNSMGVFIVLLGQ